tara:strand:+ start:175 stop:561 length:387 start_codon:yes stop_codon:yes gene_type:complete
MSTNAELKEKRLARQQKKLKAKRKKEGGESMGVESVTVIKGKKGKNDTFTHRIAPDGYGRKDEGTDWKGKTTSVLGKGKLKKGANVKKIMGAEGKRMMDNYKKSSWRASDPLKKKKGLYGEWEKDMDK